MPHTKPQHLMLPGPTPLPPQVMQAMAAPMHNHRGDHWKQIYAEVESGVKWLYQTKNDLICLAGSGTTGMEAAITNLFSAGDRVLVLTQGSFSERFAQMTEVYGLDTERLNVDWGQAIEPIVLDQKLKNSEPFKAVFLVHNETSTGVLNDLKALSEVIRRYDALSIVDAVSSLSTTELPVDQWQLDIVISASQKAYMAPPGLSFVSVSKRAWKAYESSTLPCYTLDFKLAHDYALQGLTPWTPPIPVFYALQASLKLLQAEGLAQIQVRHGRLTAAVRQGLRAMGLQLFVEDDTIASRCVTPVYPPAEIPAGDILKLMHNNYNISLGAGQRKMSDRLFRIGHLGYQDLPAIFGVLSCLEMSLRDLGYVLTPGVGVAAAQEALQT